MGKFTEWARDHVERAVLVAATTPDLVHGIWQAYESGNYKTKGGEDTIATQVVRGVGGGGVSVAAIDAAFEQLVTASGFKKKMLAQLRECYAIHQSTWSAYIPGASYSVYFDETHIVTMGRPQGGYRLDVESLRVGASPNFV